MTAPLDDVELFRRLVAFDSTSANSNLPIAGFICNYLERHAVEIINLSSEDDQKTNVVAWFGARESRDGEGLVLSGHMDVVPARETNWTSDPFALTERNGSFFARGASDMKGFLALAMNAAVRAQNLKSPLVLIFTYDEEVGTLGAHRFVQQWPSDRRLPRKTIIGEPTSLRVVSAHKGHLKLRLVLSGKSAHSGYPHLGNNAIEKAGRAIAVLTEFRSRLENEHHSIGERFHPVPFVTLNIGTIRGGTAVNIVPDFCEMEIGIRLLPGMKSSEIVQRLSEALSPVLDRDFAVETLSDSPPMFLDRSAEIHSTLASMRDQKTLESVSFATDAGWFQTMGLECVLFGPGSIEVAHRANEFMPRDEFERAALMLPRIVEKFCLT